MVLVWLLVAFVAVQGLCIICKCVAVMLRMMAIQEMYCSDSQSAPDRDTEQSYTAWSQLETLKSLQSQLASVRKLPVRFM